MKVRLEVKPEGTTELQNGQQSRLPAVFLKTHKPHPEFTVGVSIEGVSEGVSSEAETEILDAPTQWSPKMLGSWLETPQGKRGFEQ